MFLQQLLKPLYIETLEIWTFMNLDISENMKNEDLQSKASENYSQNDDRPNQGTEWESFLNAVV